MGEKNLENPVPPRATGERARQETLAALDRAGIRYELALHPAVFTVAEAHDAHVPFQEFGAKNLFLRDDRRRHHYLVSLPDEKSVSLRELRERLGSRRLSFASEEDLARLLGVIPGAVTPLGALNDRERHVEVVIDRDFVDVGKIAVHPCDNAATVLLSTEDLVTLLRDHGSTVRVLQL